MPASALDSLIFLRPCVLRLGSSLRAQENRRINLYILFLRGQIPRAQMDTCVRNLSLVQHLAAFNINKESRTEMSDRGRFRAGLQADACEEEVFCPKPQRKTLISSCPYELVKPLRQWQSPSPRISECEAGYEILEIFSNKNGRESPSFGCSPPYSLGSPPSRAGNPIVHDVQFCHRRSPPKILTEKKTLDGPTLPASPSVRIEGFDCSKQDVRRRSVPSIA